MKKHFHIHYAFAASFREETREGVEYLVVPGVAVVEGVLNLAFLPFEEIEKFHEAWNDSALVIDHPHANMGSAGSPEQYIVGRFYKAEVDASKKSLRGEFWFEIAQLQKSAEGIVVEQNIRAGRMMEVSTGFWSDLEDGTGTWKDEEYFGVYRNLRPDHIAILLEQVGACSNEDGCGVPRLNAKICGNCRQSAPAKNVKNGAVHFVKKESRMFKKLFSRKPAASETIKVNWKDPAQIAELLKTAGLGVTISGEGEALEMTVTQNEEAGHGEPQAVKAERDPFVIELQEVFGEGGVKSFVNFITEMQGVLAMFKQMQNAEETKKNALVEKLKVNKASPFNEQELKGMPLVHLQKLDQSLSKVKVNFGGLVAESVQEIDPEAKVSVARPIGLAGSLNPTKEK